ncbi:hypothetical protein FKW77_008573 [Venturia effusa]|uniref:Uncharacterized protein n=1 Tax=Venturia effusa TaxID=50376 RepID=A0A517L5Y9_9PEZI|nr:hypothetical protein FKW77_008573 [Venturia effusa]
MAGKAEDVHQQALDAFLTKDYRRAWKLCIGFMSRTAEKRPLWIEVYILRLQAYLLPSHVNAFMEDALKTCDEIERSFEIQRPTDKDLLHLGELRQQCEGHKRCFQSKTTMIETLAKQEVGAMDLGDLFDDMEFQEWAKQEMDSVLRSGFSRDTVGVSDSDEKRTEQKRENTEAEKQRLDLLERRVIRLENESKHISGKLDVLQSLVCVVEELVKDNQELKDRLKALEGYAADCHERDLNMLMRRGEGHRRKAQHLKEDEEWIGKHEFQPLRKLTLQPQTAQTRYEDSFVTAEERGGQANTTSVEDLLSRLQL